MKESERKAYIAFIAKMLEEVDLHVVKLVYEFVLRWLTK